MARISASDAGGQNAVAFLDMIAHSEIGDELLAATDDGYNVLQGSTADMPLVFLSYAFHPNVILDVPGAPPPSSAAGRYQLLLRYWQSYKALLGLSDFSPESQDRIALQQIKESHALDDVLGGRLADAIAKCAHIWASLPGASYGQHTNDIDDLRMVYLKAGGTLA